MRRALDIAHLLLRTARTPALPLDENFDVAALRDLPGTNLIISLPPVWRNYR